MVYANPVMARGLERFADDLATHGISGLIVPDLPLEESTACAQRATRPASRSCRRWRPLRPRSVWRASAPAPAASSMPSRSPGTTGERAALSEVVADVVARAKASTDVPVAVGFGIGTPELAREAADAGADGVIVGSRLVRAVAESEDPATAVHELVARVRPALR